MDFTNRNSQQQVGRVAPAGPAAQPPVTPPHQPNKDGLKKAVANIPKWLRLVNVILLFCIAVLAIAVATFLYSFNPNESKYVDTTKYQAVFLDNGQLYFGKLRVVTAKYYDLQSIFYLKPQQSTDQKDAAKTANSFTMVKLGCELHMPEDRMVINRDKVTFWENLEDDGQVVKTIAEWHKQNPDGLKCSETTGSTDQSSANTGTTGQSTPSTTTSKQP